MLIRSKIGDITRAEIENQIRPVNDCWLWLGKVAGAGQPTFSRQRRGKSMSVSAPRLVWRFCRGEITVAQRVWNTCGNRRCVRPEHHALKCDAAVTKHRRGTDNSNHRLTEESVRKIRELARDGMRQVDLADKFGIAQPAISMIVRGKTWAHVT